MRKWKILLTLQGYRLQTIVYAPSQLMAILMAKAQYPEGTNFNAIEIH